MSRSASFGPIGCLLAATAAVCAAPALAAPSTPLPVIHLGGTVTVHASHLVPGRYGAYLVKTLSQPRGGRAVVCSKSIDGLVRAVSGRVMFRGAVPKHLVCRTGAGPALGNVPVVRGIYQLLIAAPLGSGAFDAMKSFLKHNVRVAA